MEYLVFKTKATFTFSDVPGELQNRNFKFASSHGINGFISVKILSHLASPKKFDVEVQVKTERKRMFPNFESYLDLIQGSIGGQVSLSASITNIYDTMCLTPSDLVKIEDDGEYQLCQDSEGDWYIVHPKATQTLVNHFEHAAESNARQFLSEIASRK